MTPGASRWHPEDMALVAQRTPVRCSKGHIYGTRWVPMMSLKAARLGPNLRAQRCPVCHAWRMTRRIPEAELTPQVRAEATRVHDSSLP